MEPLTDGVVTLRRFRGEDMPAIAAVCSDSEIARFVPGIPHPYTEEHACEYLRRCDETLDAGSGWPCAIADAETDLLLGTIEVRLGDHGSIGYLVGPDARGRGVATRALVLLSRWAVTEGGVARLELTTHPENVASQRVAEKAGFTREGVLRSHIVFREGRRDSVLFSLLPSDLY